MSPSEALATIGFGVALIAIGQLWAMFRNAKAMQRLSDAIDAIPKMRNEEISDTLNSDEYLTADQVAIMLQVSKGTIYTWAGSSYIPALKIRGGSQKNVWRFSRRDVEAWIAEQKQPVTAKDLFARKENADESAGT